MSEIKKQRPGFWHGFVLAIMLATISGIIIGGCTIDRSTEIVDKDLAIREYQAQIEIKNSLIGVLERDLIQKQIAHNDVKNDLKEFIDFVRTSILHAKKLNKLYVYDDVATNILNEIADIERFVR